MESFSATHFMCWIRLVRGIYWSNVNVLSSWNFTKLFGHAKKSLIMLTQPVSALCQIHFFLCYISTNFWHRSPILDWYLPLCNSCQPTRKAAGCEILLHVVLARKNFVFELCICSSFLFQPSLILRFYHSFWVSKWL